MRWHPMAASCPDVTARRPSVSSWECEAWHLSLETSPSASQRPRGRTITGAHERHNRALGDRRAVARDTRIMRSTRPRVGAARCRCRAPWEGELRITTSPHNFGYAELRITERVSSSSGPTTPARTWLASTLSSRTARRTGSTPSTTSPTCSSACRPTRRRGSTSCCPTTARAGHQLNSAADQGNRSRPFRHSANVILALKATTLLEPVHN